jgi:V8-like Glu-specific endopeptidase
MGHEDRFRPPSLSGGCRLRQGTFAGTRATGETRRLRSFARSRSELGLFGPGRGCRVGKDDQINVSKCEHAHTPRRFLDLILSSVGGWAAHLGNAGSEEAHMATLSRKDQKQGNEVRQRSFRPISRDELASLGAIAATEPRPTREDTTNAVFLITPDGVDPKVSCQGGIPVFRENKQTIWQVKLHGSGTLLRGLPVQSLSIVEPQASARTGSPHIFTDSYRPPWMEFAYLPTILPPRHRRSRKRRSQNADRSFEYDFPEVVMKQYPWACIGQVFGGTNRDFQTWSTGGTGTLIGPSTIITAAHLIPHGADFFWVKFVPAGYGNDTPFGITWATQVRTYPIPGSGAHDRYRDLAVCHLLDPVGNMLGWLGTHSSTGDDFYQHTDTWLCIGYPQYLNGRSGIEWFVAVDEIDRDGNAAQLQCDNAFTTPGWSGGPLWGYLSGGNLVTNRVVGIVSGVETEPVDDTDSVFSGGPVLTDLAIQARKDWG